MNQFEQNIGGWINAAEQEYKQASNSPAPDREYILRRDVGSALPIFGPAFELYHANDNSEIPAVAGDAAIEVIAQASERSATFAENFPTAARLGGVLGRAANVIAMGKIVVDQIAVLNDGPYNGSFNDWMNDPSKSAGLKQIINLQQADIDRIYAQYVKSGCPDHCCDHR